MSSLWLLGLWGGAAGGLLGVLAALRRCLVLVTVRGPSMEPSLLDGDIVAVRRVSIHELRSGQVVVVARPLLQDASGLEGSSLNVPTASSEWNGAPPGWLIKRVVAVAGDRLPGALAGQQRRFGELVPPGRILVLGDNLKRSYDSRDFGYVEAERVLGRAICRWSPHGNTGTSVRALSTALYGGPIRSSRSVRSLD